MTSLMSPGQVIGPNVGYLGQGIGYGGTTAMFKIVPPSSSSTIDSVVVTLGAETPAFNLAQDLAQSEGLALYADTDGLPGFSQADRSNGLRSVNFHALTAESNGSLPIKINLSAPATGSPAYYVTIRPSTNATPMQKLRFEIRGGDVDGNDGDGPGSTVSTPAGADRIVLDSGKPGSPARNSFTTDRQPAGTQDAYFVAPSVASEPGLKVLFFNGPTDTNPATLLRRPEFNPGLAPEAQLDKLAVEDVVDPAAPNTPRKVLIGDGTGIVEGVSTVAKNNQLTNAVYVRVMDAAGNLSAARQLWDCNPNRDGGCDASGTPEIWNGNPVTAPSAPPTVAFQNNDTAVRSVNIANQGNVPVRVTAPSSTGTARNASNVLNTGRATKAIARIVEVGADGKADLTQSSTTHTLPFVPASGSTNTSTQHSIDTRNTIDEGRVAAVAVLTDDLGNTSVPTVSTGVVQKDVTAPIMAVGLPSGRASAIRYETARISFSEAMDTDSIEELPPVSGIGTDTEQCATETPNADDPAPSTVSHVLMPVLPDGTRRVWGVGNCFRWDAGGTGATIRFGDNEADAIRAGVGTRVYISGTDSLTDAAGNQLVGIAPVTGTNRNNGYSVINAPAAEPLGTATSAITQDLNADGKLDAIDVDFTLGVDVSSFEAAKHNLRIVGTETVPVTALENVGVPTKVRFRFASEMGTGVTPTVTLTKQSGQPTGLKGTDGRDIDVFAKPSIDKAKPRFKSVTTADTDDDGSIDRVIVTYSEAIQHLKDNNNVTVGGVTTDTTAGGYKVHGYENLPGGRNSVSWTSEISDTKIVTLAEKPTPDSGATPVFDYRSGTTPQGTNGELPQLYDAVGNFTNYPLGGPYATTAVDRAAPKIMSRATRDFSGNGRLDAIQVTFSELIPNTAAGKSLFTIAGYSTAPSTVFGTNAIIVGLAEQTTPYVGDTGATPGVQYFGGVNDLAENPAKVDAGPVNATDGAGPAIMAACAASPAGSNGTCPSFEGEADRGTKAAVFFSENVDAASVAATEFAVEQPFGTDKGAPSAVAVTPGEGNKFSVATLTFGAADTIDYLADFWVRLSAPAVVSDLATPTKNTSTQQALIRGTAFPTVNLTLTCPTAGTKAGFCPDLTVNSLVTGSSGITKWRLSDTERGTVPAAEEFTSTKPGDTITFPTEGEYTLYLSGMDAFGRLSEEISRSIWILKAPKISNAKLENSAVRTTTKWPASSTVLDGDAVKVSGDAYGTDAEEWLTAEGDCNADNMAIDVRHLTGKSTDGKVAPGTCDILDEEQVGRRMVFPAVRASGTTKYPVGTVLRISSTDPGSIVVDGPGGIARRQFISVNARRSWMIADSQVITVPSTLLAGIPRNTKNVGYRDGALLKSGSGYYYVDNGVKRPVSTYRLSVWKIPTSGAYVPTTTELRAIPTGTTIGGTAHAPGTWVKFSDGSTYQVVRNAAGKIVRRKLASSSALRTLVPSTQVYPANSSDSKLTVDSWLRGYRDGTLLRFGDGTYGVVARGVIRRFANPQTFNTLGFNASNALTANGAAVPRVSGQTYTVGTSIDRYALAPVTLTVTNIAGTAVSVQLPNAGGLYGVGTIDPVPAGWDTTR